MSFNTSVICKERLIGFCNKCRIFSNLFITTIYHYDFLKKIKKCGENFFNDKKFCLDMHFKLSFIIN